MIFYTDDIGGAQSFYLIDICLGSVDTYLQFTSTGYSDLIIHRIDLDTWEHQFL